MQIRNAPTGGDFRLNSLPHDISLSELKGNAVLIYFGFTSCPKICPTMLARISQTIGGFSEDQQKKVIVLFVSVDPERDSLEILQNYVRKFGERFIAGTQSPEVLQKIVNDYGAHFTKLPIEDGAKYTMDHSTQVFLVNAQGKFLKALPESISGEELKKEIFLAFKN